MVEFIAIFVTDYVNSSFYEYVDALGLLVLWLTAFIIMIVAIYFFCCYILLFCCIVLLFVHLLL